MDKSTDQETNGDVNPMKANSLSENVKFDLEPRRPLSTVARTPSSSAGAARADGGGDEDDGGASDAGSMPVEMSMSANPSKEWELDVRGLVSTRKWLQNYGLKKNRMDLHSVLPQIGFKHADEYDQSLKKPVCSRYANGVFPKQGRADGKTFNVASSRDKVKQLESRLLQAIALYKRRLDWLTSESRRIFGVIEEKSVTIVMDIINMSPKLFRQYRTALERVIKEQVTLLAKFNMIRATEDMNKYADECVAVTSDSVEGAINWMWSLDRTAAVSPTATCEAVVRAVNDVHTEAVYLYTEGSACDGCRELLKEKLTGARVPVHVVSINCDKADTIAFLKDLTKITGGKFHAYAVTIEMDSYEAGEVDDATNQANIILKKKTFGGVPPGAGVREDVIQLFEELEEARNTLMHLQEILDKYPEYSSLSARDSAPTRGKQKLERSETYMSSREWLAKHGLKPKKLGFYDVLAGAAFKHRDGVVDVKHAPAEEYQTDAIKHEKLVNAKYCDLFPCVRWKNGEVVHVQVTPELHRVYEQRINMALTAIKQRIDWLQQGSRELFGTVIEDKIYILIDTSASMKPHLEFVKDKLFILMQEQLRHKQEFNLIAFDSRVSAWRDRLIDVNEKSLRQAWQWIRGLMVSNGSTNTMAALRAALADHKAEAIYLLTDGRPDQPPKSMLAQVQLQPQVPIHTISFNCSDREANEFLCQLAKDTQGRFHYYSESGVELEGPEPWESEDIRLLRLELETGQKNLEKVTMLRDECSAMAWRRDDGAKCASSQGHISRLSLSPRSSFSEDMRPSSAPGGYRMVPTTPMFTPRPATASGARPVTLGGGGGTYKHQHARPATAPHVYTSKARPRSTHGQLATKPLVASHTRTSLLRSINNNGLYISPDWLLPETRQLFERQWARQQQLLQPQNNNNIQKKEGRFGKKKSKRSSLAISSKKWLSHHGLAAKKLTILDALSPTFIPHEPKFVPILNKHVLSKVFDDLLPIAHASGQRQKIRIVNPQGVDLKKYEEKVEKAIDIYTRRLDRIVWNALPQTEKESFGGEGPVSVEEERHKVMEALDRSGWPIEERNIILLENEIKQARLYIKQAQDLLAMSTVSGGDDGAANSDSGSQSGSSRDSEAKNYHPNSAKLSNRSRSPPSEKTKKAPPGKVAKAWSEESQMPRASKVRRGIGLHAGQKVIARNSENGFYYPGSIKNIKDSRNAVVRYAQLGTHIVPARFIIPVSGAISRPTLQIGDYTLCRVINEDTEHMCYVPGVIQTLPRHDGVPIKFYTVQLFTGHTDLFLQQYLIKINKIRYTFLVRYIKERILEQSTNSTTISKASSVSSASRPASASSRPRNPTPSSKRHKKRVRIKDQHHCTPPRSRSTSTTRSRSCSGSTSLSRSRSRSTSRSRSPPGSRPRSRSSSRQSSRSTSKSRSNSRSGLESEDRRSRSSTRSDSSASLSKDDGPMSLSSCNGGDKNEQRRLKKWMDYLQRQQKRQRHAQKKLNTQIAKLKKDDKKSEDHRKLLQTILEQLEQMATPQKGETSSDKDERIQAWIQNQNSSDNSNAPIGQLPPVLVELRDREKPKIGEEVLARWMDEGWYYAGTILEDLQDNSFLVKDGAGDIERIWREDVICDDDDKDYVIKPEDAVIALHPTYDYSYAPAVVKEVESDMCTRLQFYDGEESRLPREQVYHIPTQKYKMDVTYIVQCESQWVGQAVVARNDHTGTFHLAAVRKRVGNGRQYMIEWSDGQLVIQNASCMFGAFTKRHSLALGDCVLAIQDHNELMYLPGVIQATNDDMLVINFCDNSTSDVVAPSHCFWLSKDYYSKASDFYSQLNSKS